MKVPVCLINRIPSTIINNISPYEELYIIKPSILHLIVIGFLCHAKIVDKSNKLILRTRQAIRSGYSETQKSYV